MPAGHGYWYLTNYNAATHTLEDTFFFPFSGGTIGFKNADIWINKGTIIIGGTTSHLIDQNTSLDASAT